MRRSWFLPVLWLPAAAAVYEGGPGKPYSSIGAVPWESLQPGDTVLIFWKSTPYYEKWAIGRTGTEAAPITVRGVPGSGGALPVIDGNNATTRTSLRYWNEVRSVVKVGGTSVPDSSSPPGWIVIENLAIRNARQDLPFTSAQGISMTYSRNAAAIHIEVGHHLTVRNCEISGSSNGLFISGGSDIRIESNYIHSNGNPGSITEHNTYTEAVNLVYEYNRLGPPRPDAGGNNLKDRSAGLVVRYNWIEGGNRQLDLVDSTYPELYTHPAYTRTYVYGNTLIETYNPSLPGNKQVTHYGGDSGNTERYRKGTLYFYHNTVISTRPDGMTLFRASTNDERVDARNNIFYTTASGSYLAIADTSGIFDFSRNWIKTGWRISLSPFSGVFNDDGARIEGAAPGFASEAAGDYHLAPGSPCIRAATPLHPLAAGVHEVLMHYVKHQKAVQRLSSGNLDLGADPLEPPVAVVF